MATMGSWIAWLDNLCRALETAIGAALKFDNTFKKFILGRNCLTRYACKLAGFRWGFELGNLRGGSAQVIRMHRIGIKLVE